MSSTSVNDPQAESTDHAVEVQDGDLIELPASADNHARSARKDRKADPIFHQVILGLCLAVLTLSIVMSVRERTQVLVPILGTPLPELCHMRRYTGFDCPGCGLTRSFISIAHGRMLDAWRYNPAGFLLFPIMLFQIPYRSVQVWRLRRGLREIQLGWLSRWPMIVVLVVLVTQWVVRQLGVML